MPWFRGHWEHFFCNFHFLRALFIIKNVNRKDVFSLGIILVFIILYNFPTDEAHRLFPKKIFMRVTKILVAS